MEQRRKERGLSFDRTLLFCFLDPSIHSAETKSEFLGDLPLFQAVFMQINDSI